MRVGPIVAGSLLLIVGLAATIGGGFVRSAGESCIEMRCGDAEETMMFRAAGDAAFLGGALSGLAGIGLIVAGVMTDPKARKVPVSTAPLTRECPNCSAATPVSARYCPSCGCAIAPTIRVQN